MVRYYFHIRDGDRLDRDEDGTELADHDAVPDEARSSARDIAMQALQERRSINSIQIEVVSETGETVATVPVRLLLNS